MAALTQRLQVVVELENNARLGLQRLRDQIKGVDQDLKGVGTTGEKSFGEKTGISKSALIAGAAVAGVTTAVVAAGAALKESITTAANFEQAMAGVSAITGATGDDLQALTDLAKEMGSTTQFSASEAADAITFLGQAGFDTKEIIQALPHTLNLAAAGSVDLGTAADIASNVLSGMRLPVEELSTVVDGLAKTASSSNTNVLQLGSAFSQVAPGAAAAGVSFTETAAALGVLADNGIQASAGGTALNAALRTIIKPSDEATQATQRLGLQLTNADGSVRNLTEVIHQLEGANVTAKDVMILFGEEGGRAINALVGSGSERLKELQMAITNSGGAAQYMAQVQMATFEGASKKLDSALEGLQITVGSALLPVLTDLANWFSDAITTVNTFMTEVGGFTGMWAEAKAATQQFVSDAFTILDTFFTDPDYQRAFINNLNRVFSAGFRLVVTALENYGKLILGWASLAWEPLAFAYEAAWALIKSATVKGLNFVGVLFTTTLNALIDRINALGEHFGLTIEAIDFTPMTTDAPRDIKAAWEDLKGDFAQKMDALEADAETFRNEFVADAEAVKDASGEAFRQMTSVATTEFKQTTRAYEAEVQQPVIAKAQVTGQTAGTELAIKGMKGFTEHTPQFLGAVEAAGENAKTTLVSKGDPMGRDFIVAGAQGIARNQGTFLSTVGSLAQRAAGLLSGTLTNALNTYLQTGSGKAALDRLKQDASNQVSGMVRNAFNQALPGSGVLVDAAAATQANVGRTMATVSNAVGAMMSRPAPYQWKAPEEKTAQEKASARQAGAKAHLTIAAKGQGYVSRNQLKLAGGGAVYGAAMSLGFGNLASIALMNIANGKPYRYADLTAAGITSVRAAQGFEGLVSQPTAFLAGEAGPEHVKVTPATQAPSSDIHLQITINALDPRQMRDVVERDMGPILVDYLRRETGRGISISSEAA